MIVIDASAMVAFLLDMPTGTADRLGARFAVAGEELHAPHLIDVEVAHTLRRRALRGDISAGRAATALLHLASLPVTRYPHWPLLDRIWQLRENVSAYDAAYVALSESLDAPLLTLDRRLANAAGHHAQIEAL